VLYASNHTPEATEGRNRWFQNNLNGETIVAMFCGDARERFALPPDSIIDLSTISASGPTQPYAKMLNYPRTRAVVSANHYDGDKVQPEQTLIGCGGLGAKASRENGKSSKEARGIGQFIDQDIWHKDAIYNSVRNGAIAATQTHQPVLAGIHDHVYGTFTPLAYFLNEDSSHTMESVVPHGDLLDPERYDPKKLYGEGIPHLDETKLPDVFKEFLEEQREFTQNLQEEHPNLHELLRVQNPGYLFVTTEKIPTRLRYPQLLNTPGSFFQVHIPRGKDESGIHIEQEAIDKAIAQAEYPVDTAHFSNLHTIVIESGSMGQSQRIAETLGNALRHVEEGADDHGHEPRTVDPSEPWLVDWLRDPSHQVLVAQSNSGKTTQIEQYQYPHAAQS
jgi:hypothetical protein